MNGITETGAALPQYQCHKKVWALQIRAIALNADGSAFITPAEPGYAVFRVTREYVAKHEPQPGGYWVEYDNGYQSWSPAKAFQDGYRRLQISVQDLSFGQALEALEIGVRVCRAGWNGKGMWIELQRPDAHSKMTLPYIFMKTVQGDLVPWLASQTDMLAKDWIIFPEERMP